MSQSQTLKSFKDQFPLTSQRMPALFIGHGSPMNAIEDNEFSRAWQEAGRALPRPRAVLCISAHWQTIGTQLTGMPKPRTIHDFSGFPRPLYEVQYPAPGSPELAAGVQAALQAASPGVDQDWGLDHGAWSVLARLFPDASVPVVQLSLDRIMSPAAHYNLGRQLRELRQRGILILGSGNIVHNLSLAIFSDRAYDWAIEADEIVRKAILAGDHASLIDYTSLGHLAKLAIPTNEHYLPMLYTLSTQHEDEPLHFFTEGLTLGSISMRSIWIGAAAGSLT